MAPATNRAEHAARDADTGIRHATTPQDIESAGALFVEYAQWLQVDLSFQGFAGELAGLPGAYGPPWGRLLLAGSPGSAFGCIALRPLEWSGEKDASAPAVGEVKRLYVQPAHRDGGWGRRLAEAIMIEARAVGYRELKLDTLDWMQAARKLYESLGFRECAPYYVNPLPGAVYLVCTL